MKQFFVLVLMAGALMVSAPGHARLVATRSQCVAACDGNGVTSDTCSWITKRAKWTRCRAKLIKQCRKFGADTMCPAPPPPTTATTVPAPVVTTTTTTTTVPRLTTTTLPVVTYPNLIGSYEFDGYVTSDSCGVLGYGTTYAIAFRVTGQSGTSLTGTIGAQYKPASGQLYSDGSWNLDTGTYYDPSNGCSYSFGIAVGDVDTPAVGYLVYGGTCSSVTCVVQFYGTVY